VEAVERVQCTCGAEFGIAYDEAKPRQAAAAKVAVVVAADRHVREHRDSPSAHLVYRGGTLVAGRREAR